MLISIVRRSILIGRSWVLFVALPISKDEIKELKRSNDDLYNKLTRMEVYLTCAEAA